MSDEFPFSETAWILFQDQSSLFKLPSVINIGNYVAKIDEPTETIGVVTNIFGTTAEISVPHYFVRAFPHFLNGEAIKQEDKISNLIKTDGLSLMQLAHACYGTTFHTVYDFDRDHFNALRKNGPISCQHEGCDQKAIGVGIINILGTVIPVAMCLDHSYYHGYGFDSNEFNQPLRNI